MMDYENSARRDGFGIGNINNFFVGFIASQSVGLFLIVFVSIWISKYLDGIGFATPEQIFNFHPLFMTLGMVFIFGDAILVYRVLRNERKKVLKVMHAILNGSALVFALLGSWAVWHYHSVRSIPNLYSLHSWIGSVSVLLFTGQFAMGFATFLFPGMAPGYRRLVLPYHVYTGLTLFVMCGATALLGITEKAFFSLDGSKAPKYATLPAAAVVLNLLGVFIVLFVGIVIYLVTDSQFKRRPLPEEQALQLQSDETSSSLN